MRRCAMAVALGLVVSSCAKKQDSPGNKATATGPVTVTEPALERDVPEMGATYREAYEEAKREITKDNAEDKLDELEHDVNKGM